MVTVLLMTLAAAAAGVGLLILASWFTRLDEEPIVESENWRRVNAEVISVLRAGDRVFLRVRFTVGTSLIQNDVRYDVPGRLPLAGERVPIKYDPAFPALTHPGIATTSTRRAIYLSPRFTHAFLSAVGRQGRAQLVRGVTRPLVKR
jgi:hypothetical protein